MRGIKNHFEHTKRKKGTGKMIHIISTALIIPVIITILLAAFEDNTNKWVQELFGIKSYDSWLEEQKELSKIGDVIGNPCGKMNSTLEKVRSTCGEPFQYTETFDVDRSYVHMSYKKENQKILQFIFTNNYLTSIEVQDPNKFQDKTYTDMKQVFGETKAFPFEFDGKLAWTTYEYKIASNVLTFTVDANTNSVSKMKLVPQIPTVPPLKQKNNYLNESQKLPVNKQLPANSKQLVKLIQSQINSDDLLLYSCGKLGSSYDEVVETCGNKWKASVYNKDSLERNLSYQYKERSIKLSFYKDKLTYISVNSNMDSLPIVTQQVKQVFGKPMKEYIDKESIIFSNMLKYRVNDKEVLFLFNQDNQITGMELRKADMYDDKLGLLLPEFIEKNQ